MTFSQQCAVLPNLAFLTDKRKDQITTGTDEIILLIRNLNSSEEIGSKRHIWSNATSM